ncbi:MAG: hypothetical protein ACE5HU_04855 [Acidobacteriota bacterium]
MTGFSTECAIAGATTIRRGVVMFLLGAGVMIGVHLLRDASPDALHRYGPVLVMIAGAYLLVVGVEKMIRGFAAGRRTPDSRDRRLLTMVAVGCTAAALVSLGAAVVAYEHRAPYWNAVSSLNAGEDATQSLERIGEAHIDLLAKTTAGTESLAVWRKTAESALPLRPVFSRALEAARYLARTESGPARHRAEIDVRFYALCLEWMELFARIRTMTESESMVAPPASWPVEYDEIVDRIQSLESVPAP